MTYEEYDEVDYYEMQPEDQDIKWFNILITSLKVAEDVRDEESKDIMMLVANHAASQLMGIKGPTVH